MSVVIISTVTFVLSTMPELTDDIGNLEHYVTLLKKGKDKEQKNVSQGWNKNRSF